ncbi:proteasome inhibitor PI31 subunit-like, partial [Bacillus rossius redtenbacheri]|uniref:proteasome inhibitor PI31 subunit-like n=1 Tax=Bacillus rossius redtenbacheri TaxID=93214 RepID=UPI002FDE5F93
FLLSLRFPNFPTASPYGIGHSDLYPFGIGGGIGGGMLFDPFGSRDRSLPDPGIGIPGGLPRGSVPPGARFDPVGPSGGLPNPRRQPPPDSDHLPPPGYDDMFM